jgi:ribosomal protein S18 acetylase RimI-like enzyme
VDPRDLDRVAALHRACLPRSVVTVLGSRYARAFYRYLDGSPEELLVVRHDESGEPVAGAVLSLAPETLDRRLLIGTPLLPCAITRVPALSRLGLTTLRRTTTGAKTGTEEGRGRPALPQLILLFTAERARGRGHATALLARLEERLQQQGVGRYEVRTEADPVNPALAFYRTRGFTDTGTVVRFGTLFQVLTREPGARRSP